MHLVSEHCKSKQIKEIINLRYLRASKALGRSGQKKLINQKPNRTALGRGGQKKLINQKPN